MEAFEEFKNLFSGVTIEPSHILVVGIMVIPVAVGVLVVKVFGLSI